MKIKSVHFDDNEIPASVDLTMTLEEAAWLTKVSGSFYGSSVHSRAYASLSTFFNRYFHDGVYDDDVPSVKITEFNNGKFDRHAALAIDDHAKTLEGLLQR